MAECLDGVKYEDVNEWTFFCDWSSSDPSTLEITQVGSGFMRVKALKGGVVTLTAETDYADEHLVGTAAVSIAGVTYELEVTPSSLTLDPSASASLTATYYKVVDGVRDAGTDVTSEAITHWSSSDSGIATVSSKGVVTGVSGGDVTVTATYLDVTGTASVHVNDLVEYRYASLMIITDGFVQTGTSEPLGLRAKKETYVNGVMTGEETVDLAVNQAVWSVSDTSLATVGSSTGMVTGKTVGKVTVTAKLRADTSVTGQAEIEIYTESVIIDPGWGDDDEIEL